MQIIGRGRTADVIAWDDGRVLKLFHNWVPAAAVDQEAEIGKSVHAAGLPVPGVFERMTVDGRPGIVYERIDGPTMTARILARPWLLSRYARQMADLHAAMQAARVDGLPSQRDRLRERIDHADPLPDDLRTAALAALDRLPDDAAICHGDFHPENILIAARGALIIDWIDASQGHPLADVARTSLLLTLAELPPHINPVLRWLINRARVALHRTYLRRYCELRHVAQAEIDAWMLPVAAARLSEHIPDETDRVLALIRSMVSALERTSA